MTSTVLVKRDTSALLKLDDESLNTLFQRNHGGAMKVATVGVIGPPKSGKSFLLNYIMRFFKNERKGVINCMKDKDPQKPLEGFPWNCPTETLDMISIWPEPFIVENDANEKVAVFLLEFGCTESVLSYFQTFALRTCSLLIFNEIGTIPSATLNNLLFNFMESKINNRFVFPHVAFLVRDAPPDLDKNEVKGAVGYILEKYHTFYSIKDQADLPIDLKKITFTFLPKPDFSHPTFQGECAALGESFRKPFGNFISEVLETEMMYFEDGSNYTNHFAQNFQTILNVFANEKSLNVEKTSTMHLTFISKAKLEYEKIMGEKVNGKSMSENQLKQFHDSALNHVLMVFKLDIKHSAKNCEEEVESLRDVINRKHLPVWQAANADMIQSELQKEAAETVAHERLLAEQEQARRDKETRMQAEAMKRRQSEAAKIELEKSLRDKEARVQAKTLAEAFAEITKKRRQTEAAKLEQAKESFKTRQSEHHRNVGETNFQKNQYTGTAAGVNIDTGNSPHAIAIELGLKYVRAGYMNSGGNPELIPLEANRFLLPSFIGVNDKDIVFGEEARICSQPISLADLVTEMNVLVERMLVVEGETVQLRLEHLTALLLTHVKQKCEEFIGLPVSRTIITIPGWYNQELRRATKDAAFLAGFVENRLISEVSAAAIAWYNHQQLENQQRKGTSAKLLVAVASDFSFDVAGFEIDKKSVTMKKNVGRMNVCLGIRNMMKTKVHNWWNGNTGTGVAPDMILQKSRFPYEMLADKAIFVESIGYEGSLNMECLNTYSRAPILCANTQIIGAILYAGPLRHLELKEVTTYSLSCRDWTGGVYKFTESGEFLCASGSRKFVVDVPLSVFPTTRVKLDILEKVNDVEKFIGTVNVEPPRDSFQKFKLTLLVNPEGILSAEAKYGSLSPSLEFKTNNLADLELVNAEELVAGLLKSKEAKAEESHQAAFQNLKTNEQKLRKSIGDSKKLLSILKPAILKNIDKIVEGITQSSSLEALEEAVEKLSKYCEKYCKQ